MKPLFFFGMVALVLGLSQAPAAADSPPSPAVFDPDKTPAIRAIEEITDRIAEGKEAALQATFDSRDAMQRWMRQMEEIEGFSQQFMEAEANGAEPEELRELLSELRNRQNGLADQILDQLDTAQGQLTGLANRLQEMINDMDPANPLFMEGIPTYRDLEAVIAESRTLQRELEENDRKLRFAEEQGLDPISEEYFRLEQKVQDLLFEIEDRQMLAQEMDLERRIAARSLVQMGENRVEFARARSATANISSMLKRGQRRLQHIKRVNTLLERGNAFTEIAGDIGGLYSQIEEIDKIIRNIQVTESVMDFTITETPVIPRMDRADRSNRVDEALRLDWQLETFRDDFLPIDKTDGEEE